MDFLKIIFASAGSIIALFLSAKIIGNKQMSELSMFDYINGITIGSIAAEMATELDREFYFPLIAIAIYTIIIWFISFVSERNIKCRRFFGGRSILLMRKGKLYKKNFKKAKIDLNEFLTQCRINGYFKLSDIDTAILETNGRISFLPTAAARNVTTQDMNLAVTQDEIMFSVILDGNIMEENLKRSGKDKKWLENELRRHKIGNIKDVYFAECDSGNSLFVFAKTNDGPENDPFQ